MFLLPISILKESVPFSVLSKRVNFYWAALCIASPPASISSPTPLVVLQAINVKAIANEQMRKLIFFNILSSFLV